MIHTLMKPLNPENEIPTGSEAVVLSCDNFYGIPVNPAAVINQTGSNGYAYFSLTSIGDKFRTTAKLPLGRGYLTCRAAVANNRTKFSISLNGSVVWTGNQYSASGLDVILFTTITNTIESEQVIEITSVADTGNTFINFAYISFIPY